jgi:hypothetical protein
MCSRRETKAGFSHAAQHAGHAGGVRDVRNACGVENAPLFVSLILIMSQASWRAASMASCGECTDSCAITGIGECQAPRH